jgi:hypothetical protein
MEEQFYNVMVDCNGYPELENGGEKLTLDEAHEFIKKMEEYFPDNFYTIVPYVLVNDPYYTEDRTYSRWAADGWEDFYNTDEG